MIVYLDVLILENLIVNLFLLYITARTIRIKFKIRYMILAATIGSMYVLTLVYSELRYFSMLPFKIIAALIIIWIAFRNKNLYFNIKAISIFILYSMLLAGMCIFIQYNQYSSIGYNTSTEITNNSIINFSYKKLMISLMIIYMLIDRIIIYIKDRKYLSNLIYDIDIILGSSNNKSIKAFLDTGNELREPATNLPVIIVEKSIFLDVDLSSYDKFYIPYKVVNGQGGNLEGFKPLRVKLHQGCSIQDKEVIIALCNGKLSDINDYDALLSRGVVM